MRWKPEEGLRDIYAHRGYSPVPGTVCRQLPPSPRANPLPKVHALRFKGIIGSMPYFGALRQFLFRSRVSPRALAQHLGRDFSAEMARGEGRLYVLVPHAGVTQTSIGIHGWGVTHLSGSRSVQDVRSTATGKRPKTTTNTPMMLSPLNWTFREFPYFIRSAR